MFTCFLLSSFHECCLEAKHHEFGILQDVSHQGPVVQSIVSLTSPLRDQLIKCFTTLFLNTVIFFVEKMTEAFALQKPLTFFQQKYWCIWDINV